MLDEPVKYQWLLKLGHALDRDGYEELRELYDIVEDGEPGYYRFKGLPEKSINRIKSCMSELKSRVA